MKFGLLVPAFCLLGAGSVAAQPVAGPDAAVKRCVQVVRQMQGSNWFDAYYNPATRSVEDNVTYNYQVEARYPFRKCMAELGYPMGASGEK